MEKIKFGDKTFELSICADKIEQAVNKIALKINSELSSKQVIFIGILNGVFVFAADLLRKINFPCEITFIKLSSYQGTQTSGQVKTLIGLNENIKSKTVVLLEDIIDTGCTIESIVDEIKKYEPAEIKIASLLLKPTSYKGTIPIDYIGLEIPKDFVVGYGLDYNGFGRHLKDIYKLS